MSQRCGHCVEWAASYPGANLGICLAIGRALLGARAEMGYFATQPIPVPLTQEDVLRLWQERYTKHADADDLGLKKLLAETAAVLPQQEEAE